MPVARSANLYDRFHTVFQQHASKIAMAPVGAETVTYGALADQVARMAGALADAGVRPGDRVMVQAEKSVTAVVLYLATLKTGAVYNPLNTAYTATELDYFIDDAEPALVVVSSEAAPRIEPLVRKHGSGRVMTLDATGSGTLAAAASAAAPVEATVPRADDDLAALLYTSGTTGRSKGAMITHNNLTSNALALLDYWRFTPGDVLLHALPIFHVHGLFVALNTAFLNASKVIWLPRFELDAVMQAMPEATVMMGVPTFYTRLLGSPHFTPDACRRMRLVISGSAPLLAETHVAFEQRTGHRILERYGMTETGMITSNPYDPAGRVAGSVGYPLPGVSVRIATPEGQILPSGEVGVLEVAGPNVFKGYWRNPEKTRSEFRDGGYFITGDLAVMASDGRVTIVGRAKDLIISGGFNVYPKEIEDELNAVPGVSESAVVGVPHPDFGEAVVAVLTPAPGARLPTEPELIGQLAGRLAKFKLPKRVFIVPELPRNAMGKVQKVDLRKLYEGTFRD